MQMNLTNEWDNILGILCQRLSKRWPDALREMEALVERLRKAHGLPTPWVSLGTLRYLVQGYAGWVVVGSSEGQYNITIERARSLETVQERQASLATVVEEIQRALAEAPSLLADNPLPIPSTFDETE